MKTETRGQMLETIDAETLLATPLKRPKFIVEGLIPRGLTLLAGASKAGKSWMMLWMALRIAKGEEVWGLPVQQCEVLYLSLEDTMARLQDRIYQLTDKAPSQLHLAVSSNRIGYGLEEQICHHLAKKPGTRLVIIDTLQKIRESKSVGNAGIYASDYDDIGALKKLADEMDIGIIVVHHLRKMKDGSDPFNEITGSNGIMGAADSSLLLRRERGEDTAKLKATGRDIEDQELVLKLDSKKFIWHLQERKDKVQLKEEKVHPFIYRVVDFIKPLMFWTGSATELLEQMGEKEMTSYAVTRTLARFAEDVLTPIGITYETGRNHEGRYINLLYKDPVKYGP